MENRAGRWRVDKRAGHRRGGVKLSAAERGAVSDVRGTGPGDGGGRLEHVDGGRSAGRVVVDRVGRGEYDQQDVARTRSQEGSGRRQVGERAGDRRRRIKLRATERRAVGDVGRGRPGDGRGRLQNGQRRGVGCGVVVSRVGRREGQREGLRWSRVQDRPEYRRIGEGAGDRCGRVKLRAAERRAVGDVRGIGPGDDGGCFHDVDRDGVGLSAVVGRVGGYERDRQDLVRAHTEHGARSRCVGEDTRDRRRRVELDIVQRRAERDVGRVGPGDDRRRDAHVDRGGGGHAGVVNRVGRGEGDREGLPRSHAQDRAGGRRVHERAWYRRRRVELCAGERSAVGDVRRILPTDGRRRLADVDRDGCCHRVVVGRVSRSEGGRERLVRAGVEDSTKAWGIHKTAWNRRRGIELRARERCAVGDVRRVVPGDDRRRLAHVDRGGGGRTRVVGRVGRREGHRERLAETCAQHCARCGCVDERAPSVRRRVKLCARERGAVSDHRRVVPGDDRRRLAHVDRGGGGRSRVVGRVGRREGDRERPGFETCAQQWRCPNLVCRRTCPPV